MTWEFVTSGIITWQTCLMRPRVVLIQIVIEVACFYNCLTRGKYSSVVTWVSFAGVLALSTSTHHHAGIWVTCFQTWAYCIFADGEKNLLQLIWDLRRQEVCGMRSKARLGRRVAASVCRAKVVTTSLNYTWPEDKVDSIIRLRSSEGN